MRAQNERQHHPGKLYEGPLAQLVEHRTFNPWVVGSNPTGPTRIGDFQDLMTDMGTKRLRAALLGALFAF